jgi:hypothetical protein
MMPRPKSGEVWLVRFPFTDLTTTKLRPALVLATHGEDIIALGVFSRIPETLRQTWVLKRSLLTSSERRAKSRGRRSEVQLFLCAEVARRFVKLGHDYQ